MTSASRTLRHGLLAAALLVTLTGCGQGPQQAAAPTSSPERSVTTPTPTPTPTPTATVTAGGTPSAAPTPTPPSVRDPHGLPVRVVVVDRDGRSIVDAPVRPHGLDDRGVLSPPSGIVGWYDEAGWPKPGYAGAAILAGHVGTPANGPDVFRDLPATRPGDLVTVGYDSGEVVRFRVVRSDGMPKERTPVDDSIWDAGNPEPLLRLITCDPRTPLRSGHYEGNWVVWAELA